MDLMDLWTGCEVCLKPRIASRTLIAHSSQRDLDYTQGLRRLKLMRHRHHYHSHHPPPKTLQRILTSFTSCRCYFVRCDLLQSVLSLGGLSVISFAFMTLPEAIYHYSQPSVGFCTHRIIAFDALRKLVQWYLE